MKSGRRNTVENFDLLPNFVEEAVALSTGVAVASRYHTLPHKLTSGKRNKSNPEKEETSRKMGSPPKVPPHQHLKNNDSPRFNFYFIIIIIIIKENAFSSHFANFEKVENSFFRIFFENR